MVIGPNGCGKSNIADALRWIVGEQKNRLLRIERADNLIFNGSARRKPLPYAEVSLEVADFSPELPRITFTKRVHRAGDTEYLINGQPARLKDFLNYFWEMGLSPHSFLDGGQVEALIQDRAGARRALLESLAGIEKYHHQRRELLVEIEKTRHSLSEVEHLIAQLLQHISLLTQQAERVEKYHHLKETYQNLLTRYIAGEVAHYKRLINQISKEEEAVTHSFQTLENEIELLRLQLKEDKRSPLREKLAFVRAAHEELLKRHQRLAQEESRLQERLLQLQKQLTDLTEETTHRQRQEKELQTTEAENLSQLESLSHKQSALLAEIDALTQKINTEKSRQQQSQNAYQELTREIEKVKQEIHRLSTEKSRWEAQKAAIEREKQKINEHIQRLRENQVTCEAELSQKTLEIAALRQQFEQTRTAYQQLEKTKLQMEQELANLRSQLSVLQAELKGKTSERNALESLLREAAHWPPALRRLIQAYPDKLLPLESVVYAEETILSFLAWLLRLEPLTLCVSDPALLPEIEKVLAREKEGLIQIILSTALPGPGPEPQAPDASTWRLAPRIKTLPGWSALPEVLWGDVWVSDDRQAPPPGYRYLHPGTQALYTNKGTYYFIGAAKTAHIGLPHRIKALKEMEATLSSQMNHLKALIEERSASLQALPLEASRKTLEEERQKLMAAEKALAQLEARLSEIHNSLTAEEARRTALHTEEVQHQAHLQPLQEALERSERRLSELQQQLQGLLQHAEAHQKVLQELSARHAEKRYQLAQLEERLRQEEKHQRLIHQQLVEVRKRLSYLVGQQQRLTQEITEAQTQLATTQNSMRQILSEMETVATRRKSLEEALHAAEATYKNTETRLNELISQRESLSERRNRLLSRRQEAEYRIQMLVQRLEMETTFRLPDLPETQTPRLPADEVENQLQTLRREMSSLGELNFEAFTTLQQEKNRLESLQAQKIDISSALERLEHLLLHLDREAAQRFSETFEAVREAFTHQFRELFSEEDTCDMVLVEPDKPLSSSVEIVARPRGKRPLSLTQLSGGEKALTVLALLMGVLSIRPPALTILDEVDAPLDDANADKFGQLLRRFSEYSQLLVITHNKITMSYAEVLYGVTMPEAGVSTVLGVDISRVLKAVSAP